MREFEAKIFWKAPESKRLREGWIMRRSLCPPLVLAVAIAFTQMLLPTTAWAGGLRPFGIAKFTMQTTMTKEVLEDGGAVRRFENVPYSFLQAGGHPANLTVTGAFTTETTREGSVVPTQDPKDVVTDLPPGLLGNPEAVPKCPLTQVLSTGEPCPADTQIGVAVLHVFGSGPAGRKDLTGPIVNVTPEAGQSAEFGLENPAHITPLLTAHLVRTAAGYGITVVSNEIPETELTGYELTFWGVPADPSHDPTRGLTCEESTNPGNNCRNGEGGLVSGVPAVPFLTMPASCVAGPERARMLVDTWEAPGRVGVNERYEGFVEREAETSLPTVLSGPLQGVAGCDLLSFDPSIEVQPDTLTADEPVGLGVDVGVPQDEDPAGLATPQLRDTSVTFPQGLSISPGVVDGIQACEEFGPEGIDITGPESEEVGPAGNLQLAAGHCPDASIVGSAEAFTPLLPVPVKGHVYLARPGCGGAGQSACTEEDAASGRLYRLYLELGGTGALADTGVHFKVPLETQANPATGQLTTRAIGTPQAPFSDLKIQLNGGPRAPLDNPAACGPAVTTADFTPWSAPGRTPEGLTVAGTADGTPSSFFEVGGCSAPAGLSPGFVAGTVTPQAGQFSQFTLDLSREDREQYVKGIQLHTPAGLSGILANVPLCEEPLADDGHCPQASLIGSTRVASGAGSHPFEIGGKVYLTKGYGGSPFGLSIVTNAVAGPFNLGLVVVRARIDVDPADATLTVTTDQTGPYAVPQMVFGVPLRLRRITVDIDRPGFMFNPTSCAAQKIEARISGAQGANAQVSSPFAVAGCKSLAFKPKFTVSTNGHTSRAGGADLDVKLSYPAGSLGSEANVKSVKVELPKQLPSRLSTLQKACPAATFDANPGNCPTASVVGIVRATTPLLPVGLAGPVFFVSHGGEAFPSLIVVLQGDGVRVDLTGTTFISKQGITSSTFKTVPDVPVGTFELYLPEGPFSALAANGNLCRSKLVMPTHFTAQNGATLNQQTKITIRGCKTKNTKKKKPKPRAGRRRRRAHA
jgi:hypothetical protein